MGKRKEKAGRSPSNLISKLLTGLLGALASLLVLWLGGRDSWKVTCFAACVMQRAWALESAQGLFALNPIVY